MIKLRVLLAIAVLMGLIFAGNGHAQTAQTISIVQGNGQLICDGCPTFKANLFDPMVVKVTDAGGNPVPNAQVTWQVTHGVGGFSDTGTPTTTTVTGTSTSSSAAICNATGSQLAIGVSCNSTFTDNGTALINIVANTITASIANGSSVTFYLTQSPNPISNNGGVPHYATAQNLLTAGTVFSGAAGSVGSTPIQVQVLSNFNEAIPNVSVRVFPSPGYTPGPNVTCVTANGTQFPGADPGSVLTDSTGNALCYPKFASVTGNGGPFDVLVGGVTSAQNPNTISIYGPGPVAFAEPGPNFTISVTAAAPGSIKAITPTTQTANPGQSITFTAEVDSSAGSSLAGQTVTWSVSPSGAGSPNPATTTTNSSGQASTSVTLANSVAGTVTVTATSGSFSVPFTVSINNQITGLTIVSGSGQNAPENTAFAPLIVQATATTAVANIPVQFTITAGSGTLNPANGTTATDSTGRAQVSVTAGSTAGPITITATSGGVTPVTFTLTVIPPGPTISGASFLNGAGFYASNAAATQTALSPCGIGTLVNGAPLSAANLPAQPYMFAASAQQPSNVSISFTGAPTPAAPILNIASAASGQQLITFQVPCDAPYASYNVAVSVNGGTATVPAVPVRPASPGIFEVPYSDGKRRAVLVRPDGTFVSLANPARQGEIVRMYVTGAGPVQPALATDSVPVTGVDSLTTITTIVGVNNAGVRVVLTRASPNLIGVYEITFQVPTTATDPNLKPGNDVVLVVAVDRPLGNPTQFSQASSMPIQ